MLEIVKYARYMTFISTYVKVYEKRKAHDRYTIVVIAKPDFRNKKLPCLCLSSNPTGPDGVLEWVQGYVGKHLGDQITFHDLANEVQSVVIEQLKLKDYI
jgi:hypothetical protein